MYSNTDLLVIFIHVIIGMLYNELSLLKFIVMICASLFNV